LGFLYLSLSHLSTRKASGSYYTPTYLAKKMIKEHLSLCPEDTLLDPSCGTGMFLLQLPDFLPLSNLYGCDLNPVSIALTRLNLAMKYCISKETDLNTLYRNFTVTDFLCPSPLSACPSFTVILGNPPWGAKFQLNELSCYRKRFTCVGSSSAESYDLFLEQSLHLLAGNGTLSFLLPEAILNVKTVILIFIMA